MMGSFATGLLKRTLMGFLGIVAKESNVKSQVTERYWLKMIEWGGVGNCD